MDRTVFTHFFLSIAVPEYPKTKQITRELLSTFFDHSFFKHSKDNQSKKPIILSLKDIELTLTTTHFTLTFHPIFKDPGNNTWFPIF